MFLVWPYLKKQDQRAGTAQPISFNLLPFTTVRPNQLAAAEALFIPALAEMTNPMAKSRLAPSGSN
jgi:hypothetical protein